MQHGNFVGILDQEKDISEKTDKIQIMSVVQFTATQQCWFLSFDKCTLVMRDDTNRGILN